MDISESGQTAHSHRSGQVSSAIVSVCTGRRRQCGRVRGAGASKTSKRGVNQRTVISKICTNCRFVILSEFLGVNVQVSDRFGACPPLFTGCGKATPKRYVFLMPRHDCSQSPGSQILPHPRVGWQSRRVLGRALALGGLRCVPHPKAQRRRGRIHFIDSVRPTDRRAHCRDSRGSAVPTSPRGTGAAWPTTTSFPLFSLSGCP